MERIEEVRGESELDYARRRVGLLEQTGELIRRLTADDRRENARLPNWPRLSRHDQGVYSRELGDDVELEMMCFRPSIWPGLISVKFDANFPAALEHYHETTPFTAGERTLLAEFVTEEYWEHPDTPWQERVNALRSNAAYEHRFAGVLHPEVRGVDLHDRWWSWRRGVAPYSGAYNESRTALAHIGGLLCGAETTV